MALKGNGDDDDDSAAVCYKEGYGVKEMFQICDVTSASPIVQPFASDH